MWQRIILSFQEALEGKETWLLFLCRAGLSCAETIHLSSSVLFRWLSFFLLVLTQSMLAIVSPFPTGTLWVSLCFPSIGMASRTREQPSFVLTLTTVKVSALFLFSSPRWLLYSTWRSCPLLTFFVLITSSWRNCIRGGKKTKTKTNKVPFLHVGMSLVPQLCLIIWNNKRIRSAWTK